ncbi:DUF339-domain-containing protein [Neolentinus lepideus HHB14362 ss-1]|uniref:Succinate dehydrogenase assembly factor 2, mitochondrial n=1 Tax=Neolentinus lepideus HHB14362 ss-1 TaxID=1314782 RepID=A0A165SWN4_9AGAM|nr:DUF339-domain-containing protein [Neolentinus lepideus HHB14362 ss-1]
MFKSTLRNIPRRTASCSTRTLTTTSPCRADPWILPNTPEHIKQTAPPEDAADSPALSTFPPLPRHGETLENMRSRLLYQVRKRGTLETDLLLSTFATRPVLDTMSVDELAEFDKLLDEPDWDIYYWSTEKRAPPARWQSSKILAKLRKHAKNEGKEVRRMPDL